MTNFVEELRWRGLLHDIMPDTEAHLLEHATAGYIGFDPTADSLHIGSLVQILMTPTEPLLINFTSIG